MLPKFLLNAHFREIRRFSGHGRAELPLPAALVHPGSPSVHLRPNSAASPRPGRCRQCGSTGRTLSVGKGGQCQGHAVLVAFEGTGLPWAAAVPVRCHVEGCRRSGVALLSPSLSAPGPSPGRSRGLAAPGGSPRWGRSPGWFLLGAPVRLSPPREGCGVWVRGQPGRQSGMKDDFLNCISVRGLSGLMS